MSITKSKTRAAALSHVQALAAGTQKHFPAGSFTLGNAQYTTASLVQLLQGLADAMSALSAAQTSARDALAALQGEEAKVGPVIQAYRRFVLAAFSNVTQTLADFDLQPPKAREPRTSEQKVAAAAKARATRAARGTTSRKQKLAVKGKVTGITVTPLTTPVAAPPPQPVSNPPSAPVLGTVSK
jgi:hypothetical protein